MCASSLRLFTHTHTQADTHVYFVMTREFLHRSLNKARGYLLPCNHSNQRSLSPFLLCLSLCLCTIAIATCHADSFRFALLPALSSSSRTLVSRASVSFSSGVCHISRNHGDVLPCCHGDWPLFCSVLVPRLNKD